ncbi:uncharacterized protein LOC119172094 isoform X2 [Rhipicephalus microplus]|uniref:uncharacterized protein LOC119172094 isoform X2 n=1 Tax=Rhipicephalus microplus TaxID=6941 RepID=UPI003F6C46CF
MRDTRWREWRPEDQGHRASTFLCCGEHLRQVSTMNRYVIALVGAALLVTAASAAPAKEAAPEGDRPPVSAGGLLDAFRSVGSEFQRVADGFPLSFNNAASRLQTFAEGSGDNVGKSANDAFQFTRQLFKPLRNEDVQPPST